MSMQTINRYCTALFLGALLSGCSLFGRGAPDIGSKTSGTGAETSVRGDGCERNRRACNYEGAYEPQESDYAEQEAKRLNRAALERFKRNARR